MKNEFWESIISEFSLNTDIFSIQTLRSDLYLRKRNCQFEKNLIITGITNLKIRKELRKGDEEEKEKQSDDIPKNQ